MPETLTPNKVMELAKAYGFAQVNPMRFDHPEGHVLMIQCCDYAAAWADGTFTECAAGRWSTFYGKSAEDYGAAALKAHLAKYGVNVVHRTCDACGCRYSLAKPVAVDRADCRDADCRCHKPGRTRRHD